MCSAGLQTVVDVERIEIIGHHDTSDCVLMSQYICIYVFGCRMCCFSPQFDPSSKQTNGCVRM